MFGDAQVYGQARIFDQAQVSGEVIVRDEAIVSGQAKVRGETQVFSKFHVCGNADVFKTEHILMFENVGDGLETLTAFRTKDSFEINQGSFTVNLELFLEKIEKTYGDDKFAKEFRLIGEVISHRFERKEGEEGRMKSDELMDKEC